jgi:hypothetical protein
VTAFATTNSTSTSTGSGLLGADGAPADAYPLSVFVSYWNNGGGSDAYRANRTVKVAIHGANVQPTKATEYRIDTAHANPLAAWQQMGSPAQPSSEQVAALIKASEVVPSGLAVANGAVEIGMAVNSAVLVVFV